MEVGDESVDDLELEARADEQVRVPAPRLERVATGPRVECGGLERTHHGGPHCNHTPAACPRLAYECADLRAHCAALRMHDVVLQVFGPHRLKRAGTDLQRHARALDAAP